MSDRIYPPELWLIELSKKTLQDLNCIMKGHFKLSSGLHSDTYFQMAKLFENPKYADDIVGNFTKLNNLTKDSFDIIVTPAIGGLLLGYELSRQLEIPNIFFERVNGSFVLKRGFEIKENQKILIMEDVITTGKSFNEVKSIIESMNMNNTIKIGCLLNRSDKLVSRDIDYQLLKIEPTTYYPTDCELCKNNVPISVQGSRWN